MLIRDPKIYTVPQYRHPHGQPESIPGVLEQGQTRGAGLGGTSCSSQPWDGGGHPKSLAAGLGSRSCCLAPPARRRYGCAQGGTGRAGHGELHRDHGSCRTGAEGLMQGRCCQAALWLCQHSEVSWHKTRGKDLSQQSTTNLQRYFSCLS